jgi:hypothetical protein
MLAVAAPLEEWRLEISDAEARLSGVAPSAAARDSTGEAFRAAATGAGLVPDARIAAGPLRLTIDEVRALVAPLQDCGPLEPTDPGDGAYPLGATVTIRGDIADRGRQDAIQAAVAPAIGDRSLRLDLTTLNADLCTVLAHVPAAPGGSISVALGFGDREGPNLAGTYAVGDNPVIDILAPATLTEGYLWVALADVTGNNYNLLPNVNQPEQAIAALGTVEGGVRRIRVAYSAAESAADPRKPSFTVDPTFGRSVLIIFLSDRPLFDEVRPMTESVASFAKGIDDALAAGNVKILSVTKQFIESRG